MNSITQDMRFRLSIVKSFYHIGGAKTVIRYKTAGQFVYFRFLRYKVLKQALSYA